MSKFVNFIVFMICWSIGNYIIGISPWYLLAGGFLGMISFAIADYAELIYKYRGNNITDIDNYKP